MEFIAFDRQGGELFVRDLDALCIRVLINIGPDPQTVLGGCAADQIDHHLPTEQRASAPVGSDVAARRAEGAGGFLPAPSAVCTRPWRKALALFLPCFMQKKRTRYFFVRHVEA